MSPVERLKEFGLTPSAKAVTHPAFSSIFDRLSWSAAKTYVEKEWSVERFEEACCAWFDLPKSNGGGFRFRVTQGVTQSLDQFFLRYPARTLVTLPGEYSYGLHLAERQRRPSRTYSPGALRAEDILIVSDPFAAHGERLSEVEALLREASDKKLPVFIDGAFRGLQAGKLAELLDFPCIETCSYSFSKTLDLAHLRIGFEYSRSPADGLDVLQEARYIPRYGMYCALEFVTNLDRRSLMAELKSRQEQVCRAFELRPSQTVIFGLGSSEKWKDFERGGFQRVCLSLALEKSYQIGKTSEPRVDRTAGTDPR